MTITPSQMQTIRYIMRLSRSHDPEIGNSQGVGELEKHLSQLSESEKKQLIEKEKGKWEPEGDKKKYLPK